MNKGMPKSYYNMKNIIKIHFFSGLTISLFVAVHLINHIYSIFGTEAHIELMNKLRVVYRNLFVEFVLLLAIIFQVITGLRLFFHKRKTEQQFFQKLQIWSGLYLSFFLIIHVSSVFAGRYMMDLDTNIYFGISGLHSFPASLFYIPYYGCAILSFFVHVASIHSYKKKKSVLGLSPRQQARAIIFVGFLITLIIFYGLTNGLGGYEIPLEYKMYD